MQLGLIGATQIFDSNSDNSILQKINNQMFPR